MLGKRSSRNGSGSLNGTVTGAVAGQYRHRRRSFQRRARQAEFAGQRLDPIEAFVSRGFAEAAIAMQWNWSFDRPERPEPLVLVLDKQLMVEQPPPQRHGLAS